MDLLFRLSQEEFESVEEAKKFFTEDLLKRDNSYFFHTKRMNSKKLQKGDTIYFACNNCIVAKAIFTGEIKTDRRRDKKFVYGHRVENIEIIDSKLKLNTHIVSTRTTYINSKEKADEIKRVLSPDTKIVYPDEIDDNVPLLEGAKKEVIVNAYERSTKAREECIKHYGARCFICGFNFEKKYGEIGRGFIHVHHIIPLSEIDEEYEVDPIKDLRPVCPNCHAIIHRKRPAYTIEEMKKFIKEL